MAVGAVLAALASAMFFAAAATLQQREALRESALSVVDPRLLWRLAHRPWWVAGILADAMAAALHVLALSLGSITLVQPLGVTGLLFAIPMVALLQRHPVPARDVIAALFVLAGLVTILHLVPSSTDTAVAQTTGIVWEVAAVGLFEVAAATVGHFAPARVRAVVFAAAAGAAFGVTAVLTRGLLQMTSHPHQAGSVVSAAIGLALLIGVGYLMLQNAYRAGHFAASLAVAVVTDPLAAIIAGIPLLGEPVPRTSAQIVALALATAIIGVGVLVLVRSPAHLFVVDGETPARSPEDPGPQPT